MVVKGEHFMEINWYGREDHGLKSHHLYSERVRGFSDPMPATGTVQSKDWSTRWYHWASWWLEKENSQKVRPRRGRILHHSIVVSQEWLLLQVWYNWRIFRFPCLTIGRLRGGSSSLWSLSKLRGQNHLGESHCKRQVGVSLKRYWILLIFSNCIWWFLATQH